MMEENDVRPSGLSSLRDGAAKASPPKASIPDAVDVLRQAADLLEPEGAWTQGAFSRNADGSVDFGGEEGEPDGVAVSPVCWCALGAIAHVTKSDPTRASVFTRLGPLWPAINGLQSVVGQEIDEWNDEPERSQADVVAKLREAAQAIEARRAETGTGSVADESAVTK